MGASLFQGSGVDVGGVGIGCVDNTTTFVHPSGGGFSTSLETQNEAPIREAGTLSNLKVRVTSNTADNPTTVTLRKSQVDTSVVVSIGGDLTGEFEDITNSASFANTDEFCYAVAVPTQGGTQTCTIRMFGVVFTPDNAAETVSMFSGHSSAGVTVNTASATRYVRFAGPPVLNATGADTLELLEILNDGEIRNLAVYVSANARTTNTVFTLRKNSADATPSVTFGNVETGRKESASTESVVDGDDIALKIVTSTGTQVLTLIGHSCDLVTTNGVFAMNAGPTGGNRTQNANLTHWVQPGLLSGGTTEANATFTPRLSFTAKKLTMRVSANTITSTSTLSTRVNGADGAQSVSWGNSETGVKTDTTNTDPIVEGTDSLAIQIATGAGGTSMTQRALQLWGEVEAAALPPHGINNWMSVDVADGMSTVDKVR
jgi:hypothetical protein